MAAVWALGFMAAVGLTGAAGLFGQAWRSRSGTIVPATVVAVETRRSARTSAGVRSRTRTFAPVVEFSDSGGVVHRVAAALSGTRRPEIGSTVQVSYRPERPDKAIVMDLPGQAAAKWVFLVIGLVCLAAAVIVAVRS